jgi:hypothetical protein
MLTAHAAKSAGFLGYSAPDLFVQGGTAYLMVSPLSDKPVKGAYNGCDVFRFADLESGMLETDQNLPRVIRHIHGHPNTFNGACTYRASVAASGFLFGEIKFARQADLPDFPDWQGALSFFLEPRWSSRSYLRPRVR